MRRTAWPALRPHMPRPPSPPALVTAAASAGVLALPIGACRIGHLRFSLSVKVLIGHLRVYSQSFASIRILPKQRMQQRRVPKEAGSPASLPSVRISEWYQPPRFRARCIRPRRATIDGENLAALPWTLDPRTDKVRPGDGSASEGQRER